jgi:hypothetical protein
MIALENAGHTCAIMSSFQLAKDEAVIDLLLDQICTN